MVAGVRAEKRLCRIWVARRYAEPCDQTAFVRWKYEEAGCEQRRYTSLYIDYPSCEYPFARAAE